MRAWRIFFLLAGLYNLVGGTVGVFQVEHQFDPPPTYPFALQLLMVMVAVMGVGYLMVARDPLGQRGIVWIGLMTKVAGLVMSFYALSTGQIPASSWWQPLINDLPWAVGFVLFLVRTRALVQGENS